MDYLLKIIILILSITLHIGCAKNDDFTIPNIDCIDPLLIETKTVAEITTLAAVYPRKYAEKDILTAYVVSSDRENQFYQSIYLVSENKTYSIKVNAESNGLGHYTKYNVGKKVYIQLENIYIQKKEGLLQIGELREENLVSIPRSIVKAHLIPSCTVIPEHLLVNFTTIEEAVSSDQYVGKLLEFSEVQFDDDAIGKPYNNDASTATNRNIIDVSGKTLIIRTNRQSPFSTNIIPEYSGKIRGVLTKFGNTFQFVVRFETDIQLDEERFAHNKRD